jgi:hypothetical protein
MINIITIIPIAALLFQGLRNPLDGVAVRQRAVAVSHNEQGIPPGGCYQVFVV